MKKIKTISMIIEIIKLHKLFFYFLFTIIIWISAVILAIKLELSIPITLVIGYAVFSLIIVPFLGKFMKVENREKFGYFAYTIMMVFHILLLIKDYIKNKLCFLKLKNKLMTTVSLMTKLKTYSLIILKI